MCIYTYIVGRYFRCLYMFNLWEDLVDFTTTCYLIILKRFNTHCSQLFTLAKFQYLSYQGQIMNKVTININKSLSLILFRIIFLQNFHLKSLILNLKFQFEDLTQYEIICRICTDNQLTILPLNLH